MSCKMFIAKHLALTSNAAKRSDNFSNSFNFLTKLFCICLNGDFQFARLALSLDKTGCASEMKIKVRFTSFNFAFRSACTIFAH